MDFLTHLFRRETASTEFIPVIDGLRFMAILMVVMFHVNGYITEKSIEHVFTGSQTVPPFPNIFIYGGQGVQFFFVISGFILAIPFMRYAFGLSERKPKLIAYFFRRLTRLEPPYIISTLAIFTGLLLFLGKFQFSELLGSLFSSLFYVHNIVYPAEPPINPVTWSLEIEVQYYILAPLFVWLLASLQSKIVRRTVNISLIVAFAYLSWLIENYWQFHVVTLASFLQYFFAGIFLCDVVLLDSAELEHVSSPWSFFVGLGLLIPLVGMPHSSTSELWLKILSPLMILAFYLIVFGNRWWKRFFSLNGLTLIGGMCYTIYLLHYTVISMIGRWTIDRFYVADYAAFYWIQAVVYLLAIMAVSAVYFLLVEKPFMKRNWHFLLLRKIRGGQVVEGIS